MGLLLVQFLVLAFTGALWWLARRDLASRAAAAPPAPPETAELEQVIATLEALVTDLSRRLERVERQTILPGNETPLYPKKPPHPNRPSGLREADGILSSVPEGLSPSRPALSVPDIEPARTEDAHYAPIYALLDEGITDPQEIVRRTGLSRGEIDLILSLRAQRAL